MRGVINLRGAVLPIIGFAARLSLPSTEPTNRHAILVVEIGDQPLSLLVEAVLEILTIHQDRIQPTPNVALQMARDFLKGLIAIEKRMIRMIALDALAPPNYELLAAAS
jgi:purine-binding chemotaxis protein CheW